MRSSFAALVFFFVMTGFASCQRKTENSEHNHDTVTSQAQPDTVKKSIPREEHAQVSGAHVMIKYTAPAVRGRTIWGGLVPYGEVWVTGAHKATTFETDKTLTVGNTDIAPGKYAIFTIPGPEKWTIILNKNWDQHLADEYNEREDLVRLEVKPQQLSDIQERLKYTVRSDGDEGIIDIAWEKVKVSLPFKVKE
jgi:hypothetical protein